jgi:Tfp pilus assembly protein PilN
MRAVNLLPAKERGRSFQPTRTQIAVVGAVAIAGGLGYWGYSAHADASDAQAALAAARTDRDQVEAELQRRVADGAGAASLSSGDAYVEGLAAGRVDGERVLRRVATVTPPSVWYGNLILDAAGTGDTAAPAVPGAAATTAATLNLDGFTFSHTQVARLMARISTINGLGEPHLLGSKVELKAGRKLIHFTISTPLDTSAIPVTTGATTP